MKKIGILTFQNTINYGADLQLYALYQVLQNAGVKPMIINYENEAIRIRETPTLKDQKTLKSIILYVVQKVMTVKKRKKFNEFKRKQFKFTNTKYTKENLSSVKEEINNIIVGSDQIWNTNLTNGDMNYFLPFDGVSKYSYAASFGVNDLNLLSDVERVSQLLRKFDYISTREIHGKEIVEKIGDVNAQLVLDPTFLLSKKDWTDFGNNSPYRIEDKYILLYFIKEKESIQFAKKYAADKGYKLKYISMRPYAGKGIETVSNAGPEDFIKLISNAEGVITGSYHGFILSLNLNIPVIVSMDTGKYNRNSRMESIFELFDLDKRLIVYNKNKKNQDFFSDYLRFNTALEEYRKLSIQVIENIIN